MILNNLNKKRKKLLNYNSKLMEIKTTLTNYKNSRLNIMNSYQIADSSKSKNFKNINANNKFNNISSKCMTRR